MPTPAYPRVPKLLVIALERGLELFGITRVLNISGADEIALLDAVSILSEALGRTPDIEYVSARPGDQRSTHGTSERAAALLDWRPTTGIETGLRNQALHAAADHELSLSLASVSVSVST